jgi:hypothetical protein
MGDEPKMNPTSNPLPQVDLGEVMPKRLRTWVYVAGAVLALFTWLVSEITQIWLPDYSEQIMQTANRILAACAIATGGTGATYRPSSL